LKEKKEYVNETKNMTKIDSKCFFSGSMNYNQKVTTNLHEILFQKLRLQKITSFSAINNTDLM